MIEKCKATITAEREWTSLIKNEPKIKRLFFGRANANEDSIFETMFKGPFNDPIIISKQFPILLNYVWTTFQLKDHPEILNLVS